VSGLGAATADAIYGLIGGLGLTVVSAVLVEHRDALHLIGGAFLCLLGLRTLLAPGQAIEAADARPARGLPGAYASTLALTVTNPMTILSFAAIFAGMGAAAAGGVAALVAGVFVGSALWWLMLTGVIGLLHGRLSSAALTWVNRASGAIMLAFGVWAIASR
jgi:threonine/homoserine/homoserine lactone efflux protein